MKIKPFRAVYPRFELIDSPDDFCENAKFAFPEFQDAGWLTHAEQDAFYIYQIRSRRHAPHTGIVAMNHISDFLNGKIKKHEKTLREKEIQQAELFLRWNAVLKPVLLTYSPVEDISAWMAHFTKKNKPLFSVRFDKGGEVHSLWVINERADTEHLRQLFAVQVKKAYIADGHHRTTTVAMLHETQAEMQHIGDFDHLFCAFFSADQLDILDYNRVVEGLNPQLSSLRFMALLSKVCDIEVLEKLERPTQKYELTMYVKKEWYRLRWKKEVLARFQNTPVILDVSLLNELIIKDILGIQDVRTDTRITYVEGSKGIEKVKKITNASPKHRIGFVLHPVSFADMMQVSDHGDTLPPKSTYFEPRLRSGLLIKMLT
jgi:uncharacterized protein (DUF1015 family)